MPNPAFSATRFSVEHRRLVTILVGVVTVVCLLLAGLPTLLPRVFSFLHPAKVDTDPENMLPADEGVRVFHNQMKRELSLHDMVVLGVVNEAHPDGVFNPESLEKIHLLTEFAKTLRWKDKKTGETVGVVEPDILSPSTVDNIEQGGLGTVRFEWLMQKPPETQEEAVAVRKKAERIPFLNGTLLSEDGKAVCLYFPLTSKDLSYKVASRLKDKIGTLRGNERYYITGLPVAEDTFGVEMFKQMAISAPIAMLVIFLLLLLFFRKLILIISPMIVSLVSAICTMGLLVITGNTIHIMSSMIPIFIMPIAVLDAVHILSDFFDRYQQTKDRRKTILAVTDSLFLPMLYTSLTTAAGFASLALAPIPPVQVFGLFIAFGVLLAWVLTITFIPASIMFISNKSLENFGLSPREDTPAARTMLSRVLGRLGRLTFRRAKVIVIVTVLLAGVAAFGITRIRINDNPTRWFKPSHPIRVADRVLNEHFGGTYMAYLCLTPKKTTESPSGYAKKMSDRASAQAAELEETTPGAREVFRQLASEAARVAKDARDKQSLLERIEEYARTQADEATGDLAFAWDEALVFIDRERQRDEVFKQPETLEYIAGLQEHLVTTGVIGKSNSLADIVKTVNRELLLGKEEEFRIPQSADAVAQCLMTFQGSHRPQDLWHFVTPDYRKTSLWVQLRSGDNTDMVKVVDSVEDYFRRNPPPFRLEHRWFGLTFLNVVWQERMVTGMLEAFLGSFLIVIVMMILLFRSGLWGLLCMIPLTVTIGLIYGAIGLIGKDYDMPVAVLSALSLGLAVDYAIHFLARGRRIRERHGSWQAACPDVFEEPARAIARNVVVIGVGFLPLLAAPLVPYQTVGIFIAAILLLAGIASLMILPAMIRILERWLFPQTRRASVICHCGTCILTATASVALVAVSLRRFLSAGWTILTVLSMVTVLVLVGLCALTSRREKCRVNPVTNKE